MDETTQAQEPSNETVSVTWGELGLGSSSFLTLLEHAEKIVYSSYYYGESWE